MLKQLLKKLGYKPNAIAQGLALQKSTSIGLVVPEASFTYTGQVINGLIDVAKIYNYNIMLHTITAGITDINTVIEDIIKSHVDGVVIFNDKLVAGDMDTLSKYNIPIVVIGNKMNGKGISSVYVDIKKAVFELVSKYLEEGKDNIGILEDRKNPQQYEKMIAGAKKAYESRGKKFTGAISIPSDARTSYAFLSKWMRDHRYDVVIANRDFPMLRIVKC